MVMFDNIEELFQSLRDFNDYSKALVTLATATGSLLILVYFLKFCLTSIKIFRLYILSQFRCRTDYIKKYGEWACISGATDGIGLSMAKELAKRGHSLIIIGRNAEKLARTKNSLEEEANVGEVVTVKIDLSDSSLENFERIRGQIDPDHREIGILINNAGTFPATFKRFNNFDMEQLLNLVNVNVLATLHLTRMIMPGMLDRQKGLILNVSSILGKLPGLYMSAYGPTKSFMDSLTNQLQLEYASHPIDIINLTPGAVHTKLFIDTATMPKPTSFNPSPDDYARSAINAVSTRISSIAGTLTHELFFILAKTINWRWLIPILTKINLYLNARSYSLSPVMKRKNSADIIRDSTNQEIRQAGQE